MNEELMRVTQVAAYFLWEETGTQDALNHWLCAEDLACFFEVSGIFSPEGVARVRALGVYDAGYIQFVRHIAFRIFIYTNVDDADFNWFAAERLINNQEWCECLAAMSATYNAEKDSSAFIRQIRSQRVRQIYGAPPAF